MTVNAFRNVLTEMQTALQAGDYTRVAELQDKGEQMLDNLQSQLGTTDTDRAMLDTMRSSMRELARLAQNAVQVENQEAELEMLETKVHQAATPEEVSDIQKRLQTIIDEHTKRLHDFNKDMSHKEATTRAYFDGYSSELKKSLQEGALAAEQKMRQAASDMQGDLDAQVENILQEQTEAARKAWQDELVASSEEQLKLAQAELQIVTEKSRKGMQEDALTALQNALDRIHAARSQSEDSVRKLALQIYDEHTKLVEQVANLAESMQREIERERDEAQKAVSDAGRAHVVALEEALREWKDLHDQLLEEVKVQQGAIAKRALDEQLVLRTLQGEITDDLKQFQADAEKMLQNEVVTSEETLKTTVQRRLHELEAELQQTSSRLKDELEMDILPVRDEVKKMREGLQDRVASLVRAAEDAATASIGERAAEEIEALKQHVGQLRADVRGAADAQLEGMLLRSQTLARELDTARDEAIGELETNKETVLQEQARLLTEQTNAYQEHLKELNAKTEAHQAKTQAELGQLLGDVQATQQVLQGASNALETRAVSLQEQVTQQLADANNKWNEDWQALQEHAKNNQDELVDNLQKAQEKSKTSQDALQKELDRVLDTAQDLQAEAEAVAEIKSACEKIQRQVETEWRAFEDQMQEIKAGQEAQEKQLSAQVDAASKSIAEVAEIAHTAETKNTATEELLGEVQTQFTSLQAALNEWQQKADAKEARLQTMVDDAEDATTRSEQIAGSLADGFAQLAEQEKLQKDLSHRMQVAQQAGEEALATIKEAETSITAARAAITAQREDVNASLEAVKILEEQVNTAREQTHEASALAGAAATQATNAAHDLVETRDAWGAGMQELSEQLAKLVSTHQAVQNSHQAVTDHANEIGQQLAAIQSLHTEAKTSRDAAAASATEAHVSVQELATNTAAQKQELAQEHAKLVALHEQIEARAKEAAAKHQDIHSLHTTLQTLETNVESVHASIAAQSVAMQEAYSELLARAHADAHALVEQEAADVKKRMQSLQDAWQTQAAKTTKDLHDQMEADRKAYEAGLQTELARANDASEALAAKTQTDLTDHLTKATETADTNMLQLREDVKTLLADSSTVVNKQVSDVQKEAEAHAEKMQAQAEKLLDEHEALRSETKAHVADATNAFDKVQADLAETHAKLVADANALQTENEQAVRKIHEELLADTSAMREQAALALADLQKTTAENKEAMQKEQARVQAELAEKLAASEASAQEKLDELASLGVKVHSDLQAEAVNVQKALEDVSKTMQAEQKEVQESWQTQLANAQTSLQTMLVQTETSVQEMLTKTAASLEQMQAAARTSVENAETQALQSFAHANEAQRQAERVASLLADEGEASFPLQLANLTLTRAENVMAQRRRDILIASVLLGVLGLLAGVILGHIL